MIFTYVWARTHEHFRNWCRDNGVDWRDRRSMVRGIITEDGDAESRLRGVEVRPEDKVVYLPDYAMGRYYQQIEATWRFRHR